MRAALFTVLSLSLAAQSNAPFAGTWTADHQGKPLVRLELQTKEGAVSGWIQLADIHVDAQGNVDTVTSGLSERAPIADVVVRGLTIAFARHDGDDVDPFELTVTDDGRAELRFVPPEALRAELAADGVAVPKPFRLTRLAR
jgi:hypothetical protein